MTLITLIFINDLLTKCCITEFICIFWEEFLDYRPIIVAIAQLSTL